MLIHESLENHYRMNMKLMRDFGMDLDTLEHLMPFEREVYTALILEELEKKKNQNGLT